jgi:electron transfer flavoprotein alpha subunit
VRKILVLVEDLVDGALELAHAARSLGEVQATAAVCGASAGAVQDLARIFDRVVPIAASPDGSWDSEYLAATLTPWIADQQPELVLLAHSNNGLELAPLLAAQCDRPMLTDCLSLEVRENGLAAVRTLYGGKVHARIVAADSDHGYLASLRPGAFSSPATPLAVEGLVENALTPTDYSARRRCLETVVPEPSSVDITQAEILVAVGRGIEEQENLEIVQSLAEALGGELACTRPIVDQHWLEKSRQVGTSGQTVKPKIYLTVGVSGSFQHLGGVKGKPFLIAINQDSAAPIFASADVGLIGDLFDLVPLLDDKIRAHKGS